MKMKMYQVPVTEMYAIRAQVILNESVPSGHVAGNKENPYDDGERPLD